MAFDLTVLVVSTFGLLRSGGTQGSGLWKLLFRDGIVYFMVAFVGNAVAAVCDKFNIILIRVTDTFLRSLRSCI